MNQLTNYCADGNSGMLKIPGELSSARVCPSHEGDSWNDKDEEIDSCKDKNSCQSYFCPLLLIPYGRSLQKSSTYHLSLYRRILGMRPICHAQLESPSLRRNVERDTSS